MKENIGLHHVALAIQDRSIYERTVDFYRHVLEFPLVRSWGRAERHVTVLNMGNCALEIVYGSVPCGAGRGRSGTAACHAGALRERRVYADAS